MLVVSCWFIVFLTVLVLVWFSNAFQSSRQAASEAWTSGEALPTKICRSRLHSNRCQRASRSTIKALIPKLYVNKQPDFFPRAPE
jgi:hypothetical protein